MPEKWESKWVKMERYSGIKNNVVTGLIFYRIDISITFAIKSIKRYGQGKINLILFNCINKLEINGL